MTARAGHADARAQRTTPRLVLASGSPRRLELLRLCGFEPLVRAADIDETELPGEAPEAYVTRLAAAKARSVRRGPHEVVLAADTTVALGGAILGKPADEDEATAMLRRLSGRAHDVVTAVTVLSGDGRHDGALVRTEVRFAALDEATIARYVATGEPLDKAGAYGIQGAAQVLVAEVRGSWTNVVGLPAVECAALLRAAGVQPAR